MMWQRLEYDFLWENVTQLILAKCPSCYGRFFCMIRILPPHPHPPANFYKLEPFDVASESACGWGWRLHSGINRTVERRVLMQAQLADGVWATGGHSEAFLQRLL